GPGRAVRATLARAALSCAALAVSGGAWAANWEYAPRVEAGYRYSDNYHLSEPGAEIEVSGGEADAQLTMRTLDPRTQIAIRPPSPPARRAAVWGAFSLTAGAAAGRRRRGMGIPGAFPRQDVARSELPDEVGGGLGDPVDGDSGRVVSRNKRNFFHVEPYFSY